MKFNQKISFRKEFSIMVLSLTLLAAWPAVSLAQSANPPEPAYGGELGNIHIVDGNYNEWIHPIYGLDYYYFADMYLASKPENPVNGKVYLRYYCSNNTLYVLVLSNPNQALVENQEAYVKIDNIQLVSDISGNDGNPPDFAWVNRDGSHADGFEASAIVNEGSYLYTKNNTGLNVHVNVDNGGSQTSAVANRGISLVINCDHSLPVELGSFDAAVKGKDIILTWVTESEVENIGFEVYSSTSENGHYHLLSSYNTNPYLIGQGSSTTQHSYTYTIENPGNGTYWLKLADVSLAKEKTFHGPVSVTLNYEAPQEIVLGQNFPNPFNPATSFNYQLPLSAFVEMAVYSLQGERVSLLVHERQKAGSYDIEWTARDTKGNALPSGIYILRLKSDTMVKSRKIMLMR
ncbi:MAG: T9SS type A sorting domain-containing protein [Candidatus Marinimicrobia bacterium]|nr:T9SS type A sorting domain-containing protein [Candidatus Neomarinimicrobiota bacterium]